MRITVVIPSFNRRQLLARALASVQAQTSAVDEIILVDDGSTDGSAAYVADRFASVRIIRQPNRGVSAARNCGIRAAKFEWIALLDSDDCWLEHKIESVRARQRQRPQYVLYHSDEIWIRRGQRVNPKNIHRKSGGWIFERCLPLCVISPSAAVIKKSTLESLSWFDETLPACEDYDLWLRLCARHPVAYVDQPLIVKYAGHDDQLSQRYPAMDQFRIRALKRLIDGGELAPGQRAAATAMLLRKLDIVLGGAVKHGNQALLDEFTSLRDTCRGTSPHISPPSAVGEW